MLRATFKHSYTSISVKPTPATQIKQLVILDSVTSWPLVKWENRGRLFDFVCLSFPAGELTFRHASFIIPFRDVFRNKRHVT